MPDFVHLHVHTHYSMLDGACRFGDLFARAREHDMPAVAMTDHGNMFGAVEFYLAAKDAGVKPIIGCEAYLAPTNRFDKSARSAGEAAHHLLLLAESDVGYLNLIRLCTRACLEGQHYKPRIDKEILAEHSEGLLAMSACISGEIPREIVKGNMDAARGALRSYLDIFGPERFYLELMENGLAEQAVANRGIVELAREAGLRLVATNDVHFVEAADHEAHDVLLCIGTRKLRTDGPGDRMTSLASTYFRSPDEMAGLFAEIPEALTNTVEIAERCEVSIETGTYHYPKFEVPEGETPDSYLRRLVEKGTRERYGDVTGRVRDRMEHELDVIGRMGFAGYMLIVSDIVRFARETGIAVGPGRGSAVGSLVCYALGITKLDPFKYDLLFERFINEGRNEMPDIDVDFCQSKRERVIDYVKQKYGEDHVAQIVTFGTLAARNSIRDVGRVLDVPLRKVEEIVKLVPDSPGMTFARAFEQEPKLQKLRQEGVDDVAKGILDIAVRLEGLSRQPGKHAAGVVIADRPIVDCCPLYVHPKTHEVTTQYEMSVIDRIGLLKIDLLGLQTLTMAHLARDLAAGHTGCEMELDELPLDDKATFELFCRGDTKGIFQFESGGMRDLLRRARPDRFEDLVALNAMYRPGPMRNIDPFVNRKFEREEVPKIDPRVDPLLQDTFGIMVYQEQVMRIAQAVGGFSLSEADTLRKAMGKKIEKLMAGYQERFVKGAVERGFDPRLAAGIYDLMARFAEYGFNKSHSAAYAFLAYQTAYLKAHYPTEFMAALLTLDMGRIEKVTEYAEEARRMGIEILPPSVDESGVGFTITGEGKIRFGLAAVKGVGEKAVESIIEARRGTRKDGAPEDGARGEPRPFRSLLDFCERVDLRLVNKSVIECLVKAGAFDGLGVGRARVFAGVARAIDAGSRVQADRAAGQTSLFETLGGPGEGEARPDAQVGGRPAVRPDVRPDEGLPEVPEWPDKVRLGHEKSVMGIYVSGHPLSAHANWLKVFSTTNTVDVADCPDGRPVVIGGLLSTVQFRVARHSGNRWAAVVIEDLHGTMEARVFSGTLERVGEKLVPDSVALLAGKIDSSGGRASLLVDDVIPLSEAPSRFLGEVAIRVAAGDLEGEGLDELSSALESHPGLAEVHFRVELPACAEADRPDGTSVVVRAGEGVRTAPGPELEGDLETLLGPGCMEVHPAPQPLRLPESSRKNRWRERPRRRA